MMKKILLSAIFIATSLFARGDRFYETVRVTYSEPIYEYKNIRKTKEICEEVRYKVRDESDSYYSNYDDSLGVDTLIGTAAGVVLGSQIGKGNGRVAAQIVGGLLGAKVANNIRNEKTHDRYYDNYRYETRVECHDRPVHHNKRKKILTGYKNYFVYNGVKHHKFSKRPLRKIQITHTISF